MQGIEILGYVLALLVGASLGLIGSGGSILAVPILVYIFSIDPVIATAYSLFIVGSTSLVGGIENIYQKRVDFKTSLIFGIPSIATLYLARLGILPNIPEVLFTVDGFEFTKSIFLMVLFAVVMIAASISMIRPCVDCGKYDLLEAPQINFNYPMIFLLGIGVGIMTGLVGAGGGFLIIPTLVIFAKMPMKLAVGTSLFIIAFNSLLGFAGYVSSGVPIDWTFLFLFTGLAVVGIWLGILLSKRIKGSKLKIAFGWFVLAMGSYILAKELFF
ncbi:sulfite exporter TauE/SafE family protein [Algoriphagus sp. AGSA1]|uniref:sulfite exporter TauE/SafE family protein n=1 Tax=Algoriphagus sp. AGSA1 TaxID=2907213 RepID=UPI001F3D6FD8|nr:sulfite exporter TauE/SafE family protein [Algoriphagus sp. AGSA1]MCE7054647.1 sulfite exporter TauE/SafE family protein [Algoriphagus sp. AGSA1]